MSGRFGFAPAEDRPIAYLDCQRRRKNVPALEMP